MNRRRTHPALLPLLALALLAPAVARPAAPPRPRTDRYGDPLPAGAIARIGTVRFRHPSATRVFFDPRGKTLVSVGRGDLRVWDAGSGKLLRETRTRAELPPLFGDSPGAYGSTLSPDDKVLAVAFPERHISLHNAVTGKLLRRVRTRWEYPASLAFAPDGKVLAARGWLRPSAERWEVATGKELPALERPRGEVRHPREEFPALAFGLAFSPDGRRLAAAAEGGVVCAWDTATGKLLFERGGYVGPTAVAYSPDGKLLAWRGGQSSITLADSATGKVRRVLRGSDWGWVHSLAFTPGGKVLVSVDADRLRLWDVSSGKLLREVEKDSGLQGAAAFSADGRFVAIVDGARVRRWEAATGKECPCPGEPMYSVDGLALSPDGRTVAVCRYDGSLALWQAKTGRALGRLGGEGTGPFWPVFAPDGMALAAEDGRGRLVLRDVASGKGRQVRKTAGGESGRIAFTPDGGQLIWAGRDGGVVRWRRFTGGVIARLAVGEEGERVVLSADGGTAALRRGDTLRCWEVRRGKPHPTYKAPGEVRREWVWVSPDGRTVALLIEVPGAGAKQDDRTLGRFLVTVVEAATGTPRWPGRPVPPWPGPLALSPDGAVLAVAVGDTIRLWRAQDGEEIIRVRGHRGEVRALALSASGKVLVSGADDTTVLTWDLASLLPARRAGPALPPRRLERLWGKLGDADGARACGALADLAEAPCAGFLLGKLRQAGRAEDRAGRRYAKLIAGLDSDDFGERERAFGELARAGGRAEPALRRALAGRASPEVRSRVGRLLKRREGQAPPPETLRVLRAVEALERMGTKEARRALEALAREAEGETVREEAKAALGRIEGWQGVKR